MRDLSARGSRTWSALFLAVWLAVGSSQALARDSRWDEDPRNDRYVFATTRGVNQMDVHPAVRLTILPVALIVDFVFFPFALLADAVS